MTMPLDGARLRKVHTLTAELRDLQAQINHTIDTLCELTSGPGFLTTVASPTAPRHAMLGHYSPTFLHTPSRTSVMQDPPSGSALSPDGRYYANHKHGLLQIVQQVQQHHAHSRYSLLIDFADFDGNFISVVCDASSLLAEMPAGNATLAVTIETAVTPAYLTIQTKVAWRVGGQWTERGLDLHANQIGVQTVDIPNFDPLRFNALDLHLLLKPQTRGSLEIRRLQMQLTVVPRIAKAAP